MIAQRIDKARFQPSFAPLDAAHLDRFDAVVPLALSHYRDLEEHAAAGARNFLMPRREAVEICHDKLAFAHWMIANGFAAHIPPIHDVPPAGLSIRKPRRGAWGANCSLTTAGQQPPIRRLFFPGGDRRR